MKRFYTILILLIGFFTINSQAQATNDPNAKKILDGVSTKFKTFKTVKATFTYKVENTAGKALSSKNGSVSMKGTKYRVNIVGQDIFCDGVNVWTYDKAANEVTITKLDNSSNSLTPQKLFTNFYDKDFLYKLNGEKKQGTKIFQEIEMTPTDKSKPFHKVYVYVDKNGKTLSSTKVMEKSGNRYSYTVNTLTPNGTIDDKQFVFDVKKYPGVEVVDLR
ncbi:MAG TPA: outer membrane lipoprotein carrier protein LolA [Chitinophagaceae bacterium]|nr:outer membrane lipoprotein carrier protein LolA [Chitinophagaceae bacterium]